MPLRFYLDWRDLLIQPEPRTTSQGAATQVLGPMTRASRHLPRSTRIRDVPMRAVFLHQTRWPVQSAIDMEIDRIASRLQPT